MATKDLVLLLFCHDVLILLVKDVVSSKALVLTSRFRWLGSLMKIRRPCWLLLVSSSVVMMGVVLNQMVVVLELGAGVLSVLPGHLIQITEKFKILGVGGGVTVVKALCVLISSNNLRSNVDCLPPIATIGKKQGGVISEFR